MKFLPKFVLFVFFILLSFLAYLSFPSQIDAWCDGVANCGGTWDDVCIPAGCNPYWDDPCSCSLECTGNAIWEQCAAYDSGNCTSYATSCGGCFFEGNCNWVPEGPDPTPTPFPTPLPSGATPAPTPPPGPSDQFAKFIALFYWDKDGNGEYSSLQDARLPSDVLNNMITTVNIPGVRIEHFYGVSSSIDDYLRIYTDPCGVECCCPFWPSCGVGRNCTINVNNNFALGMSDYIKGLINIGASTVCVSNVNFSFTLPEGWQTTRIKYNTPYHNTQCPGYSGTWQSSSQVLESIEGATGVTSFLENYKFDWELTTRLLKVGIKRASHDPEVEALNIIPEGEETGSTNEEIYQGETVELESLYSDIDEPSNNLLLNGSFESDLSFWHRGNINWAVYEDVDLEPLFGRKSLDTNLGCYPTCDCASCGCSGTDWATCTDCTNCGCEKNNCGELWWEEHTFYQDVAIAGKPKDTQYSLSLWMKANGSSSNPNIVIWEMGGADDPVYSSSTMVIPDNEWHNYKLLHTLQSGDRTSLRVQVYYFAPASYQFDGFILQEVQEGDPSPYAGLFTDLSAVQLNINIEGDDASVSNWLRFRFLPQQGFEVFEGTTTVGLTQSVYSNQRFYLPSSKVFDHSTLGRVTLVGRAEGGDNNSTYAQFNPDGILLVHWQVTFGSDFISNSYNVNLFVRDLTSLQDKTGEGVFQIGTSWFHRLGTLSIKLLECEVALRPDPLVLSVGGASESLFADVAIKDSDPSQPMPLDAISQISFIDNPSGHVNFGSVNLSTASVPVTPITAQDDIQVASTVTLNNRNTCTDTSEIDVVDASPWWQATGGDIYAQGEVNSAVPSGQFLFNSNETNNQHGVVSYGFNTYFGAGGIASTNLWTANETYGGTQYNYWWWEDNLKDEVIDERSNVSFSLNNTNNAGDHIYRLTSSSQEVTLTGGVGNTQQGRIVILRDGDLKIGGPQGLTVNGDNDSFLLVIASGNITVEDNVSEVQGIFIADGKIDFGSGATPLDAQGSFIAWGTGETQGIKMSRDLGASLNLTTPAINFQYRPDFILNVPTSVKKLILFWEQVPG